MYHPKAYASVRTGYYCCQYQVNEWIHIVEEGDVPRYTVGIVPNCLRFALSLLVMSGSSQKWRLGQVDEYGMDTAEDAGDVARQDKVTDELKRSIYCTYIPPLLTRSLSQIIELDLAAVRPVSSIRHD